MRIAIAVVATVVVTALLGAQTNKATGGRSQSWKEYVYPADRFAITLPEAPNPHPDGNYPNTTAYTAGGMTLRAIQAPNGCESAISDQVTRHEEVRSGKRKLSPSEAQFKVDFSSVKHGDIEGYPFFEFEQVIPSGLLEYERWYCAGNRLYVFAAQWQPGEARPAIVDKVVQSFRLLKP